VVVDVHPPQRGAVELGHLDAVEVRGPGGRELVRREVRAPDVEAEVAAAGGGQEDEERGQEQHGADPSGAAPLLR
jgi:hypothetical protein